MSYQWDCNAWENLEKAMYEGVGLYDIPEINPAKDFIPDEFVKFDRPNTAKDKSKTALHFFIYDKLFKSVWHFPDRHIENFKKFGAIISPDFSVYYDFPKAIQIEAHYRRMWLSRYWQDHGINVIPDVAWCGECSYDYCFDGIPRKSIVCVSSVGMTRKNEYKKIFLDGWNEMMKRLEPPKILLYGEKIPGMQGEIIQYKACKEQWNV